MPEPYAKSQARRTWREDHQEDILRDPNCDQDVDGVGERVEHQCVKPNRENRTARNWTDCSSHGGILDQLIDECSGQLAKSREYLVWQRSQHQELEKKLQRLEELKTLDATKQN